MKATFKKTRHGHPYADQPEGSDFPLRLQPPKDFGIVEKPNRLPVLAGGVLGAMGAGTLLGAAFLAVTDTQKDVRSLATLGGLVMVAGAIRLIGNRQIKTDETGTLQEMIYFDGDSLIVDNSHDKFPKAFEAAQCRVEIMTMDFDVAATGYFLRVGDDNAHTYIGTFMAASELPLIRDMIDIELDRFRTLHPAQPPQPPHTRRPPGPEADFA